jgi:hypothetical protein
MRAYNFKNLSGQTFGSWFVTDRYEVRIKPNGKKAVYWFCRCACGVEKPVCGGQLVYGSTTKCKKCGSRKLPIGESARRTVLQAYKDEAEERGLSWLLSEEIFNFITKQDCIYCGAQPSNKRNLSDGSSFIFTGIDRVDNSRGYELDNVVPCCRICNRSKDVRSREEFIAWAERVVNHHRKRAWDSSKPFLTTETNL